MASSRLPRFVLCLVAVSFLMTDAVLLAADPLDRFETRVYRQANGDSLPYRLLAPARCEPGQKYPLVLFFHGAGERGTNNRSQLVHGMREFASDARRDAYPCFVVAPQCPDGDQWVATPWSAPAHTMPAEPTRPLRLALELVAALEKELPIDSQRLYVTGLSMGGFGVWDALQRYPQRFAAGVPICGGGDTALAARMAHVPIWAFHGAEDGAVQPRRSRDMIAALKQAGGTPRYTEYPKTGHDAWTATYRDPELYAWLFAQRLDGRKP